MNGQGHARRPYRWTASGLAKAAERARERMRALNADPEFKAKMGFLTPSQIDDIADLLRSGRRYIDIALDYLITESHVAHLAKALGLQRRPRRATQPVSTEAGGFQ